MRAETSYLGFVISENGIKPDSKKLRLYKPYLLQRVCERFAVSSVCVATTGASFQSFHLLLSPSLHLQESMQGFIGMLDVKKHLIS